MTTQEELVQLALSKTIAFESELMYNHPLAYSIKEETRYYLWMCELKRYLKRKFDVVVSVYTDNNLFEQELLREIKRILKR